MGELPFSSGYFYGLILSPYPADGKAIRFDIRKNMNADNARVMATELFVNKKPPELETTDHLMDICNQ